MPQYPFRPLSNIEYTSAAPSTDHTANGPQTSTFAAGASITIMDLVYLGSASKWLKADATTSATSAGTLAISLQSKTDTQLMKVAMPGTYVRNDTWNWTPGQMLYVSTTAGAITATQPSATDQVIRVIGWAVTADVIYFEPSEDWVTHV